MQKKEFLSRLNKIQKFIQFHFEETKNQNSIKDLEKEIYHVEDNLKSFEEISKYIKKNHSFLFQFLYYKRDKLFEDTLRYSFATRSTVIEKDDLDMENFLRKFKDFVKSMGTHSAYPYVYPVYGIGDLSQVFS